MLKGIFIGLLITLFVFLSLGGYAIEKTGYNGSFWLCSAVLYGIVVINANVYVLQQTTTHTWPSLVLAFASILSYYLCFWFENLFPFSGPMYEIFGHTMSYGRIYLVTMLNTWFFIAVEMCISRLYDWRVLQMQKQKILEE